MEELEPLESCFGDGEGLSLSRFPSGWVTVAAWRGIDWAGNPSPSGQFEIDILTTRYIAGQGGAHPGLLTLVAPLEPFLGHTAFHETRKSLWDHGDVPT